MTNNNCSVDGVMYTDNCSWRMAVKKAFIEKGSAMCKTGNEEFELLKDLFVVIKVVDIKKPIGMYQYTGYIDDIPLTTLQTSMQIKKGDNIKVRVLDFDVDKITWMCPGVRGATKDSVDDISTINKKRESRNEMQGVLKMLPSQYTEGKCDILFVGLRPSDMEIARQEVFSGTYKEVLKRDYIDPLKVKEEQIGFTHLVPEAKADVSEAVIKEWAEWFENEVSTINPRVVVALSQKVKQYLGGKADMVLPHPYTVMSTKNSEEVCRKIKTVKRLLDSKIKKSVRYNVEPYIRLFNKSNIPKSDSKRQKSNRDNAGERVVSLAKTNKEKQIVYAVVSDPYGYDGPDLDAQEEWVSPAEVENTSHNYMIKYRNVGLNHDEVIKTASVVESWVEQYPSQEDYQNALVNKPHKIYARKFGDDEIHSGAWIMGVKVSDKEWDKIQKGDLDAFSIGGFSRSRSEITKDDMPKVKIVKLVEGK